MTNGIHLFFSANIINPERNLVANQAVKLGNWMLTPVRYLLKGDTVKFSYYDVKNQKEIYYAESQPSFQKRNWLEFTAAIIFLIPGVIMGSAFKGAGYLSTVVRQEKTLLEAVKKYEDEKIIDFQNIPKSAPRSELDRSLPRISKFECWKTSLLVSKAFGETENHQLANTLNGHGLNAHVIYMQPNETFSDYPHLSRLDTRRIVLVNGSFNPSKALEKSLMQMGYLTTNSGKDIYTSSISYEVAIERQLWMNAKTLTPAGQVFLVKG